LDCYSGIGKIPDAVLGGLSHHKDLGIHTEMCSDGAMNLVGMGVVTNAKKKVHPGKIITSFANGSHNFFKWIDNNPSINFLDVAYVNNPAVIAQNPKVTSINSCIEIDLAGQVVSSTIGRKQFSGVGGQLDFVLGALMCPDGMAILALPSTTSKGESRIVPVIHEGAAVTTSREHVMYVVTEFGVANLFGKTLVERARELIKVAHPDHRETLEQEMRKRYGRV
jgi:4-hydroxybutyrate CoA-transferase